VLNSDIPVPQCEKCENGRYFPLRMSETGGFSSGVEDLSLSSGVTFENRMLHSGMREELRADQRRREEYQRCAC